MLEKQFHFVMVFVPHGTILGDLIDWKACAYLNDYQSIYNDVRSKYPSIHIHEIGHNIGSTYPHGLGR